MSSSDFELQKLNRQTTLPGMATEDPERLEEARVLVIGAGFLGRVVLIHIAEAGVGTIGIADYARVDFPELEQDNLIQTENIGKFKTEAASEDIRKKAAGCLINCHNIKISPLNIVDLVSTYDIVVDCTSDNRVHYLVSDVTELLDIPMVYGAINGDFGLLSVFNFAGGPSFRCLPEEVFKCIEHVSGNDNEKTTSLKGIIGLLQATEVVKLIKEDEDILSSSFLRIDSLTHDSEKICYSIPPGYQASGIKSDYGFEHDFAVPVITPAELMREMKSGSRLSVFDIRSPEQFIKFNIGGINVRADFLLNNPEDIPAEGKVIIVCELGDESMAIADYLLNNENITNVLNLEGGIKNWLDSNF